jgi:hypothetical protein
VANCLEGIYGCRDLPNSQRRPSLTLGSVNMRVRLDLSPCLWAISPLVIFLLFESLVYWLVESDGIKQLLKIQGDISDAIGKTDPLTLAHYYFEQFSSTGFALTDSINPNHHFFVSIPIILVAALYAFVSILTYPFTRPGTIERIINLLVVALSLLLVVYLFYKTQQTRFTAPIKLFLSVVMVIIMMPFQLLVFWSIAIITIRLLVLAVNYTLGRVFELALLGATATGGVYAVFFLVLESGKFFSGEAISDRLRNLRNRKVSDPVDRDPSESARGEKPEGKGKG